MAKKVPAINASSMADISFLLLIFFLITTSMDVSQGLDRRLPPIADSKSEANEIHNRDLMEVKVNEQNQIVVKIGEIDHHAPAELNIKDLKKKAKEFILNTNNEKVLPEICKENFEAPFGEIYLTSKHVISVQSTVETSYQTFLDVENELMAAYNEIREEAAKKYFHKSYDDLDDNARKLIQKVYPMKISEAEPKDWTGGAKKKK